MTYSTPLYGIPVPDGTSLAKNLPAELKAMGEGFEAALNAHVAIPVSNAAVVTATSAAARDSYWGTPTTETARLTLQARGATTIRTDKNITERFFATYDATTNPQGMTPAGWYPIGSPSSLIPTTRSAAERDALFGTPSTSATQIELQNRGARTYRADLGVTEQYFAAYHATNNPVGRSLAGWYQDQLGRVVQVQHAIADTYVSTTSGTPIATGISVTITPKYANSKFLIQLQANGLLKYGGYGGGAIVGIWLFKNGSSLKVVEGGGGYNNTSDTQNVAGAGITHSEIPNSISPITYQIYLQSRQVGTVAMNADGSNSSLTVWEIAN